MGDDMNMRDVTVSTGAVLRCRPVPPYLLATLRGKLPLPPRLPKLNLQSAAGTEVAKALPESPEYEEYRIAQQEWERKRTQIFTDFTLDFGIVEWRLPESEEWTNTPPDGWQLDPVLVRWGLVEAAGEPRVAYIKSELIVTDADMNLVDSVTNEPAPVTEGEVQQALVPFVSPETKNQSSGQPETGAG